MYISTLAEKKQPKMPVIPVFFRNNYRSTLIPIDCIEKILKIVILITWHLYDLYSLYNYDIFLSVFTILIIAFKNLLQEHFLLNFSNYIVCLCTLICNGWSCIWSLFNIYNDGNKRQFSLDLSFTFNLHIKFTMQSISQKL